MSNAKAYDKKTAAFIGFLIQNIPEIDDATMNRWIDDPDALKRFLTGLEPPVLKPPKPIPLFSVAATTYLGIVGGKKTNKCFTGSRYAYRDDDFDNWLPKDQPNSDAGAITTLASSQSWTFAEAAAFVLGIGAGTEIVLLGKLLIEHGHTMTLAQVEEMVEATELGKKTEMRTDGYANFFFVETGNLKDPVSVGHVFRDERWNAYVLRLDDVYRCYADYRLLVRNLDTQKL